MREDTIDNLSIAHISPTKLINFLSINPTKTQIFFPHHINSIFLAVASLFLKEIWQTTCRRPAPNDFLQVLAILSSLIPFSSRNPCFPLYYKSPHSTKCLFNSILLYTSVPEDQRESFDRDRWELLSLSHASKLYRDPIL